MSAQQSMSQFTLRFYLYASTAKVLSFWIKFRTTDFLRTEELERQGLPEDQGHHHLRQHRDLERLCRRRWEILQWNSSSRQVLQGHTQARESLQTGQDTSSTDQRANWHAHVDGTPIQIIHLPYQRPQENLTPGRNSQLLVKNLSYTN